MKIKKHILKKHTLKKGAFYTLAVLLFLIVVSTIIFTYGSFTMRDIQQSVDVRIRTMNDFVTDFHSDVHRSTRISATRALIAMEQFLSDREQFFSNRTEMEEYFREVFYYGTIDGIESNLMENASFQDYEEKVNLNARNINVDFTTNVTAIELYQTDPWELIVVINCTVKLDDFNNLARWRYNATFRTVVPIIGLRDPLYSINTYGRFQNTIHKTNVTVFASSGNASGLLYHLEKSLYIDAADAPSFLMRFYNDSSGDFAGIESFVNLNLFSDQGLEIYTDRIIVDHEYFSDVSPPDTCNIQGMPSWFKLDSSDLNKYDINELNYTSCP